MLLIFQHQLNCSHFSLFPVQVCLCHVSVQNMTKTDLYLLSPKIYVCSCLVDWLVQLSPFKSWLRFQFFLTFFTPEHNCTQKTNLWSYNLTVLSPGPDQSLKRSVFVAPLTCDWMFRQMSHAAPAGTRLILQRALFRSTVCFLGTFLHNQITDKDLLSGHNLHGPQLSHDEDSFSSIHQSTKLTEQKLRGTAVSARG